MPGGLGAFAALGCTAEAPRTATATPPATPPTSTAAAPGCLGYGPEAVVLRGVLERQSFPGPPDYASVAAGDREETFWFLRLDEPICTRAASEPFAEALSGITRVQLVLPAEAGASGDRGDLAGRRVTASGGLFGRHTGHHHEPVLLEVGDLTLGSER